MGEQERSPEELDQQSQDSKQQTSQNGFIKDSSSKLYLPIDYLSERDKKPSWLLKPRRGGKTIWDWLGLLFVPALIATIAGAFTLITVDRQNEISRQQNEISKQQNEVSRQQNEIFKQRDEAAKEHNQQELLIKYLDDISELVEKQLLTFNDDENSETQRTIARARTLSVLRALDSDRQGELIQFLSVAKLIERDKPIINLDQANLGGANLKSANLKGVNLSGTHLDSANLEDANLQGANLERAHLDSANLEDANLQGANLERTHLDSANLEDANLQGANLERANLEDANLQGANLERAYLDSANLGSANLERANLADAHLWSADLWSANLQGAILRSSILADAHLWSANLQGAILDGAYLNRARLWSANLRGAILDGAIELNPAQVKIGCNWEETDFSEEFKQKLAQEPDQKIDCSKWD